jgi:acyl carrier protein
MSASGKDAEERRAVREFAAELLRRKSDPKPFADDESLVLSGRLDSVDVLDVAGFLERRFGFALDPSRFDAGKLDSVDRIAALLKTRRKKERPAQ